METTCPICSQGIEIDPVTLNALQGTPEFDCPTCGGPVPVPRIPTPAQAPAPVAPSPVTAGPKAIQTTCPICAQGIELSMEAMQSLRGTSEFDCPTCGGPVPVPGAAKKPAAPATPVAAQPPVTPVVPTGMEVQPPVSEPHSQPLPPAPKAPIAASAPASPVAKNPASPKPAHTPVSAAAKNPPTPVQKARVAPATPVAAVRPVVKVSAAATLAHTHRGLNRNLILLGTLALLVLGGLGIYLATRKGANTYNTKKNISNEIARNKFITDLVASGATTAKELEAITGIRPLGIGFVGVSREKLTWEQALALAKRTASRILTIEPSRNAAREPVLSQLSDNYPDLRGSTVWAMENGEPRVIDGPDVNRVTTLDRPRVVLFNWYPVRNDKDRPWVKIKALIPKPEKINRVGDWIKVQVEYNNPGTAKVAISAWPRTGGKNAENYGNGGLDCIRGLGILEPGFTFTGPSRTDELWVTMWDLGTEEVLASAMLPLQATWIPDPNIIDVEIISVRPPATLSPTKEITIPAKAGEKFTLGVTARYKAPVPTKLASNLLLKDANILPPEFIQELSANHSTTWHFDTESRPGYHAVEGAGEISYDLTGYAPKENGAWMFNLNLGLFDKQTWATEVLKLYKINLIVGGSMIKKGPKTIVAKDATNIRPLKVTEGSCSVSMDDAVLIEGKDGSKAVVQLTSIGQSEANYKWRFRSSPSAAIAVGTGRVFEDYEEIKQPDGVTTVTPRDPESVYIKAGTIKMEWSSGGLKSSWLYRPGESEVTILRGADFETKP